MFKDVIQETLVSAKTFSDPLKERSTELSGIEWPVCKLQESKHRSCQPKTQNKTTDRPGTDPVLVSELKLKHSDVMPDAT